jgi:hypothetical protein
MSLFEAENVTLLKLGDVVRFCAGDSWELIKTNGHVTGDERYCGGMYKTSRVRHVVGGLTYLTRHDVPDSWCMSSKIQ